MVIGYIQYRSNEDNINFDNLLRYFQGEEKAKLYNKVGNILWYDLGISSAEINLITGYIVDKILKEMKENGKKEAVL